MALPKINSPVFTIELPSTKKPVKFRPFTVKEEKLLLMAAEGKDTTQINDTIKQVLNNCFVTPIDIDKMAVFDVEYVFVQLRSKSVNNMMKLQFKGEDEKTHKVEIDLDDVVVAFDPEHTNKIVLSDDVTITMRYPSFDMIEKMSSADQQDLTSVLRETIDKVVSGEEVLELKDYTSEEVDDFISSFTSKNMRDIEKFFITLPKMKLDINYTTEDGVERVKEVVGLQSFFTS